MYYRRQEHNNYARSVNPTDAAYQELKHFSRETKKKKKNSIHHLQLMYNNYISAGTILIPACLLLFRPIYNYIYEYHIEMEYTRKPKVYKWEARRSEYYSPSRFPPSLFQTYTYDEQYDHDAGRSLIVINTAKIRPSSGIYVYLSWCDRAICGESELPKFGRLRKASSLNSLVALLRDSFVFLRKRALVYSPNKKQGRIILFFVIFFVNEYVALGLSLIHI